MTERNPQTIQATAKRWKAWKLAGIGLTLAGIVLATADASGFGVVVLVIGLAAFVIGALGRWWHHG